MVHRKKMKLNPAKLPLGPQVTYGGTKIKAARQKRDKKATV